MLVDYGRIGFVVCVVLGLATAPAAAQTGTITGTVRDSASGAGVQGVEVRAEAAAGVIAASTFSGANGQFRLAGLTAGTYTVHVRLIGWRAVAAPMVDLTAGQNAQVDITLEPSAIAITGIYVETGIRRPEKYLESPNSQAVVAREKVEEQPALEPTGLIAHLPGVDRAQTGLFSSTVVARGFNNVFSTALLAMTDYRYTNVPSLRVNTTFLMPAVNEDIERIEVLLGPGSALYGPNAANGVMHILTHSPFARQGTTLSVGGGERDVVTTSLRHASVVGERFGYKVTGQYMRGREWRFIDQEEIAARQANPTIPARDLDLSRWSADLRADYRLGDSATAVFTVGRVTAESAIEMTPFGAAQAKGWEYSYYQGWLRAKRLFLQGFVNTSRAGDTFLLRTGAPIVDESRLLAAQVQHSTPLGERQNFIYGVDLQRTDPRTGGTIHGRFEDDDDSNEIGGYLVSETRLSSQFRLVLAGRYDYHSRATDNVLSPRAALTFQPSEPHNFRVTYNRAFSTPLNSQLFLDLPAGTLGALPFQIRGIGASPGYTYRRDCNGGICVRSPFPGAGEAAADPARLRNLDATAFWGVATNILYQSSGGSVDIRALPAPTAAQVGTVLRMLNPNPAGASFSTVDPASLRDIAPLTPTISNTFELGYKGLLLGDRLHLAVDLWHQRRDNFVSASVVETPNMFFERTSLTAYLSAFMSPQQAAQIAAAMAGIDGSPGATGIPLGTAGFDHAMTNDPNVYLTFRNYGDVKLWGSDVGVQAALSSRLMLTGAYSWVNDDRFRTVDAGGERIDVVMNAPANKGSLGLRWTQGRDEGLSISSTVRFVDAFPMNSGVYVGTVRGYTLVDAGLTWRVPGMTGTRFTIHAQNLLDREHQQFVGAPNIGRLLTGQITYTLGGDRSPTQ